MAVTDQNLMNEGQYLLLETPNNGASYGSGLYTTAEVVARANYRADLFNKLTGVYVATGAQTATSGTKAQDISTAAPNFIDILDVFYSSDAGVTYYHIPRGSSSEVDDFIKTQSAVTLPSVWAYDTAKPLGIILSPAPTFTGSNGKLTIIYVPRLGVFPATPDGTSLSIPDDFTPFIKYGFLADLFGKSGEAYDPFRASVCEGLFQLGVELTKGWITGADQQ